MKTYEIVASGYCRSRVLEISADGEAQIVGDFPSAMDAQKWIDSYLGMLCGRQGASIRSASPLTRERTDQSRHARL